MAKYVSDTDLGYYHGRIKTLFAAQADLDTLEDKVDEIVAEGGEPNVIETVKVNGTALVPDAQKAVNIEVPNVTVSVDQDPETYIDSGTFDAETDGRSFGVFANTESDTVELQFFWYEPEQSDHEVNKTLATTEYVDSHGGKIDTIKVNGTAQTITNKAVDITVPTAVSDLTNDSGYQTASDVSTAISTAVASAYTYKGSVATQAELPSSGNKTGDVYDVQASGMNYAWTGTAWDALGTYVDTSLYWAKADLVAMTTAEIDALFA